VRRQREEASKEAPKVQLYALNREARPEIAAEAWRTVRDWSRDEPGAAERVRHGLTTGSSEVRLCIMEFLGRIIRGGFRGREIAEALVANLSHDDASVVRAAALLCSRVHVPGAADRALVLARQPDAVHPGDLVRVALADHRLHEALAVALEKLSSRTDPIESYQMGCLLHVVTRVVTLGGEPLSSQALTALEAQPELDGFSRGYLERCRNPVAMASRLPDRRAAIDALLELARTDNRRARDVIEAIGEVAKGSHDGQLAERLMVWQASHARAITFALLSIGGPDARHHVLELLPQLSPEPRAEAIWALEGWTLVHLLGQCRGIGLISHVAEFEADRASRHNEYEYGSFSLLNPLVDLLAVEGAAVHFQAEHRQYPPRYDHLIRRFMRCTQPWLRLSALTEVVDYADGTPAGFTVQFVARGRRYRLEMFHHTKRYYPRYIVPMLNTVVRESGHDEEFVAIEDADQRLSYLFGPIEAIHRVSRQLFIPLMHKREIADEAVEAYRQARL
jgi:hypothetical protein